MKVFLFCCITWLIYLIIGVAIAAWLSLGVWSQVLLGSVLSVFWLVGNELFEKKQRDS